MDVMPNTRLLLAEPVDPLALMEAACGNFLGEARCCGLFIMRYLYEREIGQELVVCRDPRGWDVSLRTDHEVLTRDGTRN